MGSLTMATPFAVRSASVNIDTVNAGGAPDDWAIWTSGALTPDQRRNGGGSTIGITAHGVNSFSTVAEPQSVTWTNGTPTASGTDTGDMFNSNFAAGNGFNLTFPADTSSRTVWIYAGPFTASTGTINASLSDGSATTINDTTNFTGAGGGINPLIVIIQYSANSASQTLTVQMFTQVAQTITMMAAAVAVTSAGSSPVLLPWQQKAGQGVFLIS